MKEKIDELIAIIESQLEMTKRRLEELEGKKAILLDSIDEAIEDVERLEKDLEDLLASGS